jgi:antitoxin (DNA-binding transcriptional repressor) of toxin-antitoxin stability system
MRSVSTSSLKVKLPSLFARVAKGERIIITRYGVPLAIMGPPRNATVKMTHEEIIEGMRELRNRVKPDRMGVREMVVEGPSRKPRAKTPALRPKRPKRLEDYSAIGMWADREDMKDPSAWVRKIRAPRYDRLGRRRPKP